MSPESAISPPWRELFNSSRTGFGKELAVVAIDEVHCNLQRTLQEATSQDENFMLDISGYIWERVKQQLM